MEVRSTNIDEAELALRRRNELTYNEEQFNKALSELLDISKDFINRPSYQLKPYSINIQNKNSISESIELLNNLLVTFDNNNQITKKNDDFDYAKPSYQFRYEMLSDNQCENCNQSFGINEQIVNAAGHLWHTYCFVCTQCFQPFENGIYFEHENRKYCEKDFQMLFAPCCAECKQPIVGRIIRAVQKSFHPDCFRCQLCHVALVETGFSKYNGQALCRECHSKEKTKNFNSSKQICSTCHETLDNKYLIYKGELYHPFHFQCTTCRAELDENSREVRGSLYCVPCHNNLDLSVCAACRRLIDGRVINALGKQWHAEHFCCARCAQPFYGSKHFENKGLAYCESDYHFLFGSLCFICNTVITEGIYTACNKKYCIEHFSCSLCEKQMNEKSKFFDVDATPVCKQCYDKLPSSIRKSLEQHDKKKPLSSTLKQTSV